jgi:hypothetical protein
LHCNQSRKTVTVTAGVAARILERMSAGTSSRNWMLTPNGVLRTVQQPSGCTLTLNPFG